MSSCSVETPEKEQKESDSPVVQIVPRKAGTEFPMVRGLIIPLASQDEYEEKEDVANYASSIVYPALFKDEMSTIKSRDLDLVPSIRKISYYPNFNNFFRGYSTYYSQFRPVL